MLRCFGRGSGRVIGVSVWLGLMAVTAWRIASSLHSSTGLGIGPLAGVFVFAAPACWFVGVLVAALVRAAGRSYIARRHRRLLAHRITTPQSGRVDTVAPPRGERDENLYLPVPKPFHEMEESEVDTWIEVTAATMLDSISTPRTPGRDNDTN